MTTPTHILAVDPGGTTGYAIWSHRVGDVMSINQTNDRQWFLEHTEKWLEERPTTLLVVESFTVTVNTAKAGGDATSPLEIIGALRFIAGRHGATLTLSDPSMAKQRVTDDTLRRLDWWPSGMEHARDALRHLAVALMDRRLLDPRIVLGSQ